MDSNSKIIRRQKGRKAFRWAAGIVALMIVLYTLLYQFAPFSQFVNDLLANLFIVAASATSATLASLVRRRYSEKEPSRDIWINLEIALWLWVLAETIWAFYNMLFGEVQISLADSFWIFAYGFLFTALFVQYHVLFHPAPRQARLAVLFTAGSVLLLLFASGWLLNVLAGVAWDNRSLINLFYPSADIVIAILALRLAYRFRAGALSYPWISLFVFTISDLLYALLDLTGAYSWSVDQKNLLSTVADVTYLAAYLAIGLGCYAQWLLLKYGPIFVRKRKP